MPPRARRAPAARPVDAAATDVLRYLRQSRRRGWLVTALAVVAVLVLAWVDWSGYLAYDGSDVRRYDGRSFRVVRVVDGDTLVVDAPDPTVSRQSGSTRVRLWGIDTPELAREGRPAAPYAEAAADEARRLAEHADVTLHLRPERVRDRYGRLLAYVTLPAGDALAERLLLMGLAYPDDRWPHELQDRYARLADQARHDRRGVWSE